LGPDGKVHFTDTHTDLGGVESFCIDLVKNPKKKIETQPVHEGSGDEDEVDYEGLVDDYAYEDDNSCQGEKDHNIIQINYCSIPFVFVMKCCEYGKNINLRYNIYIKGLIMR
jgi:hypothetical protein